MDSAQNPNYETQLTAKLRLCPSAKIVFVDGPGDCSESNESKGGFRIGSTVNNGAIF